MTDLDVPAPVLDGRIGPPAAAEPRSGEPACTRPATVSVVVVTHDSAGVIGGCLRSLQGGLAGIASWEVVVVDNASADGTCAEVERVAPGARLLALGDNRGYAAAINAGIAASGPDGAILVLNPDVRLRPGSVAALVATLDDGVGIAVPRLLDEAGIEQPSLRRQPTARRAWAEALLGGDRAARIGNLGETVLPTSHRRARYAPDWATGAAFLVSRACLDAVGPLDESFFLYSEETDFMLRARDAGHPVRPVTGAEVVHLGGELGTDPDLWALRTVNRVHLQRRRTGRWSTSGFLAASIAGESLRAAAGRTTSRRAVGRLLREGPRIVLEPARPPTCSTTVARPLRRSAGSPS